MRRHWSREIPITCQLSPLGPTGELFGHQRDVARVRADAAVDPDHQRDERLAEQPMSISGSRSRRPAASDSCRADAELAHRGQELDDRVEQFSNTALRTKSLRRREYLA